jgi:hypothetical protein
MILLRKDSVGNNNDTRGSVAAITVVAEIGSGSTTTSSDAGQKGIEAI